MRQTKFYVALATGILIAAGASASAQVRHGGFHHGHGFVYPRPYRGFGWGIGFGYPVYPAPVYTRPVYRNAFTGDVAYAERSSNAFRAEYERQGDPFGVKADVQRLDETLERMRGEAERYGGVTLRGSDLMRDAELSVDAVDRRLREARGPLAARWDEVRRTLDRLAQTYRVR